ncbi:Peroxidase [Eumeta japonica]|uniref:Peroxidase n=1 Tax=Eumeta variegata TaxID=151549 RepID=A0A4C1W9W5_EUMVA|nr:Peroxidase [Eumeta japonica]
MEEALDQDLCNNVGLQIPGTGKEDKIQYPRRACGHDVELAVGAALEPPRAGALCGETNRCVISDGFKKGRRGDRFFYQNCEQGKFTPVIAVNVVFSHAFVTVDDYGRMKRISPSPNDDVKCVEEPKNCSISRYRSIDGSCNNLEHSSWGMRNKPYGRLCRYNYADGKHALPKSSSGKPLPNARLISCELFPPKEINDPEYTLLTMQFGQFVTHDMSLTADSVQIAPLGEKKRKLHLSLQKQSTLISACTRVNQGESDAHQTVIRGLHGASSGASSAMRSDHTPGSIAN